MEAHSKYGVIIAIAVNITGTKLFSNLPNDTIVGTLLFTLSLAALIDFVCEKFLPKSIPFVVHMAVTMLFALYVVEMLQATFWIPVERMCAKMATAVGFWASKCCSSGMGSTFCTLEQFANYLTASGLIPVAIGSTILLTTLKAIQAPYVLFACRPAKKTWRPPRPPTPFPNDLDVQPDDDSSNHSQDENLESVYQIFPSGSVSERFKARAAASVRGVVDAFMKEVNSSSEEVGSERVGVENASGDESDPSEGCHDDNKK